MPDAGHRSCSLQAARWSLLLLLAPGCSPSADAPLPPETDLYSYSLAVAEKAWLKATASKAKPLFFVGRVHERFGLEDKALEAYSRALELDAGLAEAHRRIGFILSQRKDRMPEAVQAYQESLRIDPQSPGVHTRLGLVFTHMGRLADAEWELKEEIRASSASEETHYNLAQVHALQGKHSDAIASYQEAIRLAPAMRSAHYGMATSLREIGKTAEAGEALKKFQALKQAEDAAAAGQGPVKDTRQEHLRFASESWMDAAEVYVNEATATQERDRRASWYQEFVQAVTEAIRLDPRAVEPRKVLVTYYAKLGDMERATATCEEALKAISGDGELAGLACNVGAQCLSADAFSGGSSSPATLLAFRLFKSAAESAPGFAPAKRSLVRVILFRLKDRPELLLLALEHARLAVELDHEGESYDLLAFAYYANRRHEEAVETLEQGLARHPDYQPLKERLGKVRGQRPSPQPDQEPSPAR